MSEPPVPGNFEPTIAPPPSSRGVTQSTSIKSIGILVAVYALWVAVAGIYWPSARDLSTLWTSPEHEEAFTHGYLILVICLWLVFRERERLAAAAVAPSPKALLALLTLSALWLWSWRAVIQEAHELLLPLILLTAIVAALGSRIGRSLVFPVGYLYFAMPIWSDINGLVQALSAKMTGVLIFLTGLPAFMQGDYVQLPRGEIEIASTCSGLHALIVGLALATLYGKIAGVPLRRRGLWIAVMGALSLIVNWVRIFTVITAAVFTDMHSSLVRQHYWLGWWLFAFAFAGFLWWTGRTPVTEEKEDGMDVPSVSAGAGHARLAATLAVLAVLPLTAYGMDWAQMRTAAPIAIAWPAAPPGWSGPATTAFGEWQPKFVDPSAESFQTYTDADGQSIQVFTVAYRVQTQDAKVLSFWNHLLAGPGRLQPQAEQIVNSASGRWRETRVVDSAGLRSLVWSRYRVGNRLFVEPRLSQLWYGLEALIDPPRSSLTALRAVCTPTCAAANARLLFAASHLRPTLR